MTTLKRLESTFKNKYYIAVGEMTLERIKNKMAVASKKTITISLL